MDRAMYRRKWYRERIKNDPEFRERERERKRESARRRRAAPDVRDTHREINRAWHTANAYEIKLARVLGIGVPEARKMAMEQCR